MKAVFLTISHVEKKKNIPMIFKLIVSSVMYCGEISFEIFLNKVTINVVYLKRNDGFTFSTFLCSPEHLKIS